MTVVVLLVRGVPVKVHHTHPLLGHQGCPFVAQVADAWLVDRGPRGRAKRFRTPESALDGARRGVAELLALRAALVRAWLP